MFEKVKEFKDLTVEAEFTNNFQKLESLELEYLYLFFHPFSFLATKSTIYISKISLLQSLACPYIGS
jgi:hypothetical protein